MMLGDLISKLDDNEIAEELLLATGDAVLIAHARERCSDADTPLGEFLLGEIGRFSQSASPDAWLGLMTATARSDNPGGACLASVLRFSLEHAQCAHELP